MKAKALQFAILIMCMYLGLFEGHLAIYRQGQKEPEQILPYSVTLYPEKDRRNLEAGIPFSGAEELAKLLQDYTG